MPILQQNDAAAVARYTEFVTRSPWGNLMQDRGWAHVKKGWVGEQVYLEQNGEITAAMSIIFAPAVAGRTLAYAPRGPVCDPYDTETIAALMREAAPALKKHRAFLLRFDPETPYTDELIAKYEKLGLRCRARNCGLHDQIQPRFNMFLPLEGKTLEELMPAAMAKAQELCKRGPLVLRYLKACMNEQEDFQMHRKDEAEVTYTRYMARHADFKEGVSAFLEKREPQYQGK